MKLMYPFPTRKILPLLLLALLPSLSCAEGRQFTIEFKFAEVPHAWVVERGLTKVSQEVGNALIKDLQAVEGLDLLSAPKVTTNEKQEARIVIGQEPLYYMEKVGESYQPKQMPEGTGPGISVTVTLSDVSGHVGSTQVDLEASLITVVSRKPLPIGLDVGMPVINKQEVNTTLNCFNGKWHLVAKLGSLDSSTDKPVLVFARVDAVNNGNDEDLPLELVADKISRKEEKGILLAEGNVRIHSGGVEIYAESLEFNQDPGGKSEPGIQADRFSFDEPGGRVTLAGNVTFRTPEGLIKSDQLKLQQVSGSQQKRAGKLEQKLKAIIIPSLDFKEVGLGDAIDFLRQASKQHSPDGNGVNILVKPNALLRGQGLSLSLRNLSVFHILKCLADCSDNSLVLDEEAGLVVIGTDKSADPLEDPFEH